MKPNICRSGLKIVIPFEESECEYWLVRVIDKQSISDPDRDHAYYTDNGELFIFDGKQLVQVNFNPIYTTEDDIDEFVPSYVVDPGEDDNPDVSTNNYNDLENKPSINSVTLIGDKTTDDLDIYDTVTDEEIDEMF